MLLAGGAEQVLHTDDLGNFKRPKQQQMVERDVAHSDAGDQSVIAGLHHGAQLVVKPLVGWRRTQCAKPSPSRVSGVSAPRLFGFVKRVNLLRQPSGPTECKDIAKMTNAKESSPPNYRP
jgi:hypothetical protein